jgi:hypothetical protein
MAITKMNNREHTMKANKNKFSDFVEGRKAQAKAKDPKVKKVLSPEKIAEKEAGLQAFLEKKAMRKRLRAKAHA